MAPVNTVGCPYCAAQLERTPGLVNGMPFWQVTHAEPLCYEWSTQKVNFEEVAHAFQAAQPPPRTYPQTKVQIVLYDTQHLPERSDEGDFADKPALFAQAFIPGWPVGTGLWPLTWHLADAAPSYYHKLAVTP